MKMRHGPYNILISSLFVFLAPFVLSCNPIGAGSGFNFTLGQNSTILINAQTSSCAGINSGTLDTNVSANYFQLSNMAITWTSSSALTIQYIRFTITSPDVGNGSEFVCEIASSTLMSTWVNGWNVVNPNSGGQVCTTLTVPQSVTIVNGQTPSGVGGCNVVGTQNNCPFSCGGITMTNPARSSSGVVNVTVYATYSTGNGNVVPIAITKPLTYSYTGFSQ
jgi:hypothetical protein